MLGQITHKTRDIVVAFVNGDLAVKHFVSFDAGLILKAENSKYEDIHIDLSMLNLNSHEDIKRIERD